VLTKALNKVDTDDDDWASLRALGNHLNRTDPSFDARTYGFAKLSDLVKAQAFLETKTVTGTAGRGQLWVRLKRRREASQAAERQGPDRQAERQAPERQAPERQAPESPAPEQAPAKKATKAAKAVKKTTKKAAKKAQASDGGV
jgi:hypothetical protein